MHSQSTQAVTGRDLSMLKLKTPKEAEAKPVNVVSSSSPSRSARPVHPGGVFYRLQGLFPPSLSPSYSISTPTVSQSVVTSPSVSNPQFIKTRMITWNMHDSLPKGDLEELLGSVPLYTPRSILDNNDRMALPGLSLEDIHPYHLIVVGGQECPTLSGIPMGLAANFKHWDGKERDKEKHTDQDLEKDREREKSKEKHLLHHTKSLLSKHLKHEYVQDARTSDNPRDDPTVDDHQVYGPAPTSGWSAVLEDWFANGVGSLHNVKPVITTAPSPRNTSRTEASSNTSACTAVSQKPTSSKLGTQRSNTLDVNWQSTNSRTNATSFSASEAQARTGPYELLVKERLMGIYMAIYVHRDVRPLVEGFSTGTVPAGLMGGRLGNKGGVGISVNFHGTRFLFINAHLAAHEGNVPLRVANLAKIKAELPVESFLSSDDPRIFAEDLTDRFDYTWIFGDLNFRLDISRLHADWLVTRKEYRQALAFDQLSKLMQDGDPTFAGLHEAKIDFPPTFKYDVLRTVKQREKHRSRYTHQRSKSSVDEVGEKDPNSGNTIHEDYDDEFEDANSLRSSAWTSNGSKFQIDAAEDGSDHSPTSSHLGGDRSLIHTSKIVSHAAIKAKAAWITFLNASRDVQVKSFSPKQRRRTSAARMGLPGSSVESSQATRATSDQSVAHLSPPIRRTVSDKTSMAHQKPEDEVSYSDMDKGVYDSSSKQRVPSWCDRILWKSTVEPPDDLEPEPVLEPETEPTRSRGRSSRVGQLFNQAFRPRIRRDSAQAESNLRRLSDLLDDASPSDKPPLTTSPGLFQSKSLEPLPGTSVQHVASSLAVDGRSRPRSVSAMVASAERVPRRLSLPVFSRPVGLWQSPRRAETDQLPAALLQDELHAPTSLALSPQRGAPKRWFLNFNFISRDHAPSPSTPVNPASDAEVPSTRPPKHRKGDVICLSYRTLDDRQMRRLEGEHEVNSLEFPDPSHPTGRSDHRPVIGSYVIYV